MLQENYGEIFSKRLKELRQEKGLTIEQFASEVGISKSSIGYYENQNRVPDIVVVARMADVLNVSIDYLAGRSDARTNSPKLKSICDKVGLSDKSVLMLARLKKEDNPRLRIINMLLEQADEDITDDYDLNELEEKYEGSFLNAVCRYLSRYPSYADYDYVGIMIENISLSVSIWNAMYQLILNQAIDALKSLQIPPKPSIEELMGLK